MSILNLTRQQLGQQVIQKSLFFTLLKTESVKLSQHWLKVSVTRLYRMMDEVDTFQTILNVQSIMQRNRSCGSQMSLVKLYVGDRSSYGHSSLTAATHALTLTLTLSSHTGLPTHTLTHTHTHTPTHTQSVREHNCFIPCAIKPHKREMKREQLKL